MYRALALNAALIAVPALVWLVAYLWDQWTFEWEEHPLTGDPVLHQSYFWFTIEPVVIVAYFAIPNLILAGIYACFNFRRGSRDAAQS